MQPGEPRPRVLEKVSLDCRDFSAASAFPFTLSTLLQGNGEFKMKGKVGPINQADAAATPVEANFTLAHLDLASSGLIDAASGGAGLISLEGGASAKGHAIHIKGKLKGEKLKLSRNGSPASRPVELDWTVDHDRLKRAGTLRRGEIHLGSAVATLAGGYNLQGHSPSLNMKVLPSAFQKIGVTSSVR